MSAMGQKQTFAAQNGMSALSPKADIRSALTHVRFGPRADIPRNTITLILDPLLRSHVIRK